MYLCYIVVVVNPALTTKIIDLSSEGRNMTTFLCQAVGEPAPNISWYFNNAAINVSENSSKYMIMSRSLNITTIENTLTVYNVTSSDVGVYACTATNILGNDTEHGKKISF